MTAIDIALGIIGAKLLVLVAVFGSIAVFAAGIFAYTWATIALRRLRAWWRS
jgi:hypothetical protein